ncbi:MAG: hypothetical protein LH614_01765, partial [Pyrinomonadaceae bacterium]|nr:hypothetical protein [Pyrinomonadaceae bacterium]
IRSIVLALWHEMLDLDAPLEHIMGGNFYLCSFFSFPHIARPKTFFTLTPPTPGAFKKPARPFPAVNQEFRTSILMRIE